MLFKSDVNGIFLLQANVTQVDVNIPHKHHNALIGAKGRLIRSIMDECGGVSIKFPPEGTNSDKVLIRGPKDDVEKAKKQLLQLLTEKVIYFKTCHASGNNNKKILTPLQLLSA